MTAILDSPTDVSHASVWSKRSVGFITLLALVPLFILIAKVFATTWYPTGDNAMLVLRVQDVGTSQTPLLGPYSRYGWNHPGPLMFYLLAVPYRLLGAHTWGVMVGVLALNVASIAAMMHLFWTYSRMGVAAIAAGASALLVVSLPPSVLESLWNPDITMLPFALFVVSAWATRIDVRWLPLLLGVATFLVQSHAGFAPMVLCLCAWSLLALRTQRPTRKTIVTTGVVMGVCWLPVVVDELFGTHNIRQLLDFFATSQKHVGMGRSLSIASRELTGVAPWLGGPWPYVGTVTGRPAYRLLLPVAVWIAAFVISRRRSQRNAEWLLIAAAIGVVSTTFAVSRITDGVGYYLIQFWTPLAMVFWVAIAYALFNSIDRRHLDSALAAAVVIATICVVTGNVSKFVHSNVPTPLVQSALAATFPTVVNQTKPAQTVFIEADGINGGWIRDAMCLELERHNRHCLLGAIDKNKVGADRVVPVAGGYDQHLMIATGEAVPKAAADPQNQAIVDWQGTSAVAPATNATIRILQGPPNEQLVIYRRD